MANRSQEFVLDLAGVLKQDQAFPYVGSFVAVDRQQFVQSRERVGLMKIVAPDDRQDEISNVLLIQAKSFTEVLQSSVFALDLTGEDAVD